MTFLIQQTLIYAVPLMIVALAGVFAERSGIINLALEGIMIFGAFIGVLFVRTMQGSEVFTAAAAAGDYATLQGLEFMAMAVAALMGAIFSLLLSFASINLRADQTIGGTALNLLAPALVLFFIRIIANQNTLQMAEGDAASWFMIKKSMFGYSQLESMGPLGETFINRTYLATYLCILLFIILAIILYKTRFGLRLRACGENPQAADSLGINVYKMRYAGTTISGALAGMGGFVYSLTTANCTANGDVAGFGFLALAVMIFGNWKPLNIAGASLLFGLFKCVAASYSSIDVNGDGVYLLADWASVPTSTGCCPTSSPSSFWPSPPKTPGHPRQRASPTTRVHDSSYTPMQTGCLRCRQPVCALYGGLCPWYNGPNKPKRRRGSG